MAAPKAVALIMAGGSGTRFWPLSRPDYPKQFLKLLGDHSLIRETVERVRSVVDDIFVCSAQSQRPLLNQELPDVTNLILEPSGRNTAPCLMMSLAHLLHRGFSESTVMIVLPADHHIRETDTFRRTLAKAVSLATETKGLVTMGIRPTSPHTGYGYIESDGQKVKRFVEKPSLERAKEFLALGNFYWNSGMFVWTLGALKKAFETFCPEDWKLLEQATTSELLTKAYAKVKALPIDVAVMEKATNVFLLPADFDWSDIGSWNALHELEAKSSSTNVALAGEVKALDASGCLVHASGKQVALVGVKDLIVVESEGTILIVSRDQDQKVREAAKLFET